MYKKGITLLFGIFLAYAFHLQAVPMSNRIILAIINDSIAPVEKPNNIAIPKIDDLNNKNEIAGILSPGSTNGSIPQIDYLKARKYEIADIKVTGLVNKLYEDYTIIGFSQLAIGDVIEIPGSEISNAVTRYWKQGMFSEVSIVADKIEDDKIWLNIILTERPRISNINFTGVSKGEKKDLESKIGMVRELQSSRHQLNRAKEVIRKYYDEKGFNKAVINIQETPDLSKENYVVLDIDVQKKNKTKVENITITGTEEVAPKTLTAAMKKTRFKKGLRYKIRNFLRSTNYVPDNYENDKTNLIEKYNELGYRDAEIISDTVYTSPDNPNKVQIDIDVNEGPKYYIRDIHWVGNTQVASSDMDRVLLMKGGDVYNQKKLIDRLSGDEDAVMNLYYQNNGYLFSNADPVEINISNDSVDLEIRVTEGPQATIRKVVISGNDRIYEDVVRRELRTKPGALYSRNDILMSMREIGQMGHFHLEGFQPDIVPDAEEGVVDIAYPLQSKANDQVEFSAGWGSTGIIGRLSLKFTNFSIKNLFNPKSYKGFLPQGDGQTLSLSAQTNARYYNSFSINFLDPWFGGKRPNSLSVGAYYSRQSDVQSSYANSLYNSSYSSSYYGNSYGNNSYDLSLASDASKSIEMIGLSVGFGKRLNWPDDNFFVQAELSYQNYKMKDWQYFVVRNGTANAIALTLSLNRRSIDDMIYPKNGSEMSLSVAFTPPFSSWDNKDYSSFVKEDNYYESSQKYKWIEYHKWKFKMKTYTSLFNAKRTPVIMTRTEFGLLGYYNKNKKSPFETFYMGGDGMTGYSGTYATETIGLRGYENGSIATNASAYTRFGIELRYPLILEPTSTIYLLTFAEGGNAWSSVSEFNPFELKRSAGFGARIMLPMIGLMGIDWAYGFDPINGSRSQSGSQFHFIIGQEF